MWILICSVERWLNDYMWNIFMLNNRKKASPFSPWKVWINSLFFFVLKKRKFLLLFFWCGFLLVMCGGDDGEGEGEMEEIFIVGKCYWMNFVDWRKFMQKNSLGEIFYFSMLKNSFSKKNKRIFHKTRKKNNFVNEGEGVWQRV